MAYPESYTYELIPLAELSIHELVSDELRLIISSLSYSVDSETALSSAALELFLYAHPVIAVRRKNKTVACVGGIRSLIIASNRLSEDKKIPVLVVDIPASEIEDFATFETFVSNICYGNSDKSGKFGLFKVWEMLTSEMKNSISPETKSKTKVAKLLGINRKSLYKKPQKLNKNLDKNTQKSSKFETDQ